MKIINSIKEMKEFSAQMSANGKTIGFVPTMGALHRGHLSLVEVSKKYADICVMSIFVNPTQFGPNEDFEKYPRLLEQDLEKAESASVDAVFIPNLEEMYNKDASTFVVEESISTHLCGKSRPKHFKGVCTVVCKLFNIIKPNFAIFGEKDAQQVSVIKRMVRDLFMDITVISAPLFRDNDGLATSSRNSYLSEPQKRQALLISKSLVDVKDFVANGCTNVDRVIAFVTNILSKSANIRIIYVNAVDAETSIPVNVIDSGKTRICIAVWLDNIRLIDNILV